MVVMFDSEQFTSGKVGNSDKTLDKATNSCEFGPGGTHNKRSSKQLGKALFNN